MHIFILDMTYDDISSESMLPPPTATDTATATATACHSSTSPCAQFFTRLDNISDSDGPELKGDGGCKQTPTSGR